MKKWLMWSGTGVIAAGMTLGCGGTKTAPEATKAEQQQMQTQMSDMMKKSATQHAPGGGQMPGNMPAMPGMPGTGPGAPGASGARGAPGDSQSAPK